MRASVASSEPSVNTLLGEEPAGFDGRLQAAVDAGAYSITCSGHSDQLKCLPMKDEDVIPALRRGETIYGRTVLGFPTGATTAVAEEPKLEATDLMCSPSGGTVMSCAPVTTVKPTVAAGAETFVFYRKHNVTFDASGTPVSIGGTPTVSLEVVPSG